MDIDLRCRASKRKKEKKSLGSVSLWKPTTMMVGAETFISYDEINFYRS